jgi:hypothetical protein
VLAADASRVCAGSSSLYRSTSFWRSSNLPLRPSVLSPSQGPISPLEECSNLWLAQQLCALWLPLSSLWKLLGDKHVVRVSPRISSLSKEIRLRSLLALEWETPLRVVGLGVSTRLRIGLSASRVTGSRRFVKRGFSSSGSGVRFSASRRARLCVVDGLSATSVSLKSGSSCACWLP